MDELSVVQNGNWKFLLEGKGKRMIAWPYHKGEAVAFNISVKGRAAKKTHYKKTFPYPSNHWERSTKILTWCKRFADNKAFRDSEVRDYKDVMNIGIKK